MRKLWKRFKHWLIKKLGGYVKADKELVVGRHQVYPMAVVAQKRIGFGTHIIACARDRTTLMAIEDQIGYLLGSELIKQGLVTYSICEDIASMEYTVRGIIQVIPPIESRGTDLASVLRGGGQ